MPKTELEPKIRNPLFKTGMRIRSNLADKKPQIRQTKAWAREELEKNL